MIYVKPSISVVVFWFGLWAITPSVKPSKEAAKDEIQRIQMKIAQHNYVIKSHEY